MSRHTPKYKLNHTPTIWRTLLSDVQARSRNTIYPRLALNIGCHFCLIDNQKDPRVFAHTRHIPNTVCVHPHLDQLPPSHIRGILAHEIGHILSGEMFNDWSEEAADTFCLEYLGYPLDYDSFHGMWLQKIDI
jgi:hypothetical protein